LLDEWRPRDPVKRFEDHLIATRVLTADDVGALRTSALAEVDEAQAWAEASPPPDPSEVERGVYCEDRPWP
jgi:TPP-dependent pyruvate/acetoin dehydrogenase alpha subunit